MAEFIQTRYAGGRCYDAAGTWRNYCLPIQKICYETETDGYLVDCDKEYNLIRCADEPCFRIPFKITDRIHIQTQFFDLFNPDPENPVSGWGSFVRAILTDEETGTTYTTELNFTSKLWVCHNGTFSYQTLELDLTEIVTTLGINCFSLQLFSYEIGEEETPIIKDTRCTHEFSLVPEDCEPNTVLFDGIHPEIDCKNYYYGDPILCPGVGTPFAYDPTIRLPFKFLKSLSEIKDDEGARYTVEKYELFGQEFIPNQILNHLFSVYLQNKYVLMDNIKYELLNFVIEEQDILENSAFVNFSFEKVCAKC